MFKLINRITWIISIILGLIIMVIFRDSDFFFFGIIAIFFVKYIFFSKDFINERLDFFSKQIKKGYLETIKNENIENNIKEEEIKTEITEKEGIKAENIGNEKINILTKEDYLKLEKALFEEENGIKDEAITENKIQVKAEIEEKIETKKENYIKEDDIFEKIGNHIKEFFSENLLAKIGGILIFLGVLFFLNLIYIVIGPVWKLIIGFLVGFSLYFTGTWLEKKGYIGESKIVLGSGILVNYLVILSGRFLIGETYIEGNTMVSGFLSTGITFLFLILNTIFAVITSLVYKSRNLLIFSFIFAYLNPFLIGGSSSDPYVLIGYSFIVSLGGIILAIKEKNDTLLNLSIILGNILFLIAPFSDNIGLSSKVITMALLGLITIFSIYKYDENYKEKMLPLFITNYVFLLLLIFIGIGKDLNGAFSLITYLSYIFILMFLSIFFITKTAINSMNFAFLIPLFLILVILFGFGLNLSFISIIILITILSYLFGFNLIETKVDNGFKYIFFIILGAFILFTNVKSSVFINPEISLNIFLTTIISSFIFMISAYNFSKKDGMENLYAIGTIGSVFMLSSVIIPSLPVSYIGSKNIIIGTSALSVLIFAFFNLVLPFVNTKLLKIKNIINLLTGSIAGILFISFELYKFGNVYFPGVSLGIAFLILSIVYFGIGALMFNSFSPDDKNIDNSMDLGISKDSILNFLGISISLFSFSITLIFSNNPEIISTIWIFEATLLYFFYNRNKEMKLYVGGCVLFLIGIVKLGLLESYVNKGDFVFLVPFAIIFLFLAYNLSLLDFKNKTLEEANTHNFLHIIGIITLGFLLQKIIPSTGHGWSFFGTGIFLLILSFIYSYFNSKVIKTFFIILYLIFTLTHLSEVSNIFNNLENDKLNYLKAFQYITVLIMGIIPFLWSFYNKQLKYTNTVLKFNLSIYLMFILSIFVYDIFDNTFSITIFWSIIAFLFIQYGITKELIKYRTIGLYIITLVCGKIFLYDIWYGLDNAISRVVAFMFIGIIFLVISTKYSKKYGSNLKGEFNLENIVDTGKIEENLPK